MTPRGSTHDADDLHLGVGLSVTDLLLLVLLGLVLQDMDLLALAVLNDVGGNGSALNVGSAAGERIAQLKGENLIKGNRFPLVYFELFDEDDVAFRDLVLLSAGFDNCVHEKHLSFFLVSLNSQAVSRGYTWEAIFKRPFIIT